MRGSTVVIAMGCFLLALPYLVMGFGCPFVVDTLPELMVVPGATILGFIFIAFGRDMADREKGLRNE